MNFESFGVTIPQEFEEFLGHATPSWILMPCLRIAAVAVVE